MHRPISLLARIVLLAALATLETLSQSPLDTLMQRHGLIDIQSLDPSIRVDLRYSSTNNFIGEDMYEALERAYLEPRFAARIVRAQHLLKKRYPNYTLLIYDAARPMSVQAKMHARVAGTPLSIYVAPAKSGGRHNYGVAVDLTIADTSGQALDMGTDFDHFGPEAHTGDETTLVRFGTISAKAARNRQLLRNLMRQVGLRPYAKEWWHYQETIPMSQVRRRYRLINDL